MGGIDGNNLQFALDTFHYTCRVHEYSTYTYSVDVECRALYRVRIHYAVYAQRKIYKHHVRLVRLNEYITV